MDSPVKEVFSLNPVVFGIHSEPVAAGGRLAELMKTAAADTSLLGSSDYIQPKDARLSRTAREIVAAETDTLSMARMLSRWVFARMKKDENIAIIRSVDILHSLIGGRDEHVKLFAALARSIRIPVQINMGLLYENGAFRYHSWPSVLAGGTFHDLDPWYGQDTADAARVALVSGDFERLSELLRLMDSFTITILEYR
jgi:transglutaminase-like putative cysteine protease